MAANAVVHLKELNAETDRRHDRRSIGSEEFVRLVEAASSGPTVQGVAGEDRCMLYILAVWTGFRRRELGSLTRRSFKLNVEPPIVQIEAGYSKRRRNDSVPLHLVVVEQVKHWLANKADHGNDQPLFEF